MFLLLFLFLSVLFSKDTITWIIWDLPPNYIINGEKKGKGYQDIRLKILQDKMPSYNHETILMNVNRAIATYKNRDDSQTIYCTNDLISHPTLDIDDYLSMATFHFEATYLVASKEKAHLFGKTGESVVLKDLIQNPDLRLVVSKNRPYLGAGKVLDAYLKNHPQQKHITFLSTLNIGKSMYSFVFANRADYTFEYPFRATYYGEETGFSDKMVIFPIKENEGVFYGFVSCIKTKKGRQVIDKVNDVLREVKPTNEWLLPFVEWLPTKALKDSYIKYYKEVFLPSREIYDTNPRSK